MCAYKAWELRLGKHTQSDLTQKVLHFFHSNTVPHLKSVSSTDSTVKNVPRCYLQLAGSTQLARPARPENTTPIVLH